MLFLRENSLSVSINYVDSKVIILGNVFCMVYCQHDILCIQCLPGSVVGQSTGYKTLVCCIVAFILKSVSFCFEYIQLLFYLNSFKNVWHCNS